MNARTCSQHNHMNQRVDNTSCEHPNWLWLHQHLCIKEASPKGEDTDEETPDPANKLVILDRVLPG